MPRLLEAKKDVTSCEKPRGEAHTRRNADLRMGQPVTRRGDIARSARRTRGTETSHYPEEKKTKVIAQVVASERAGAQTGHVMACAGVEGPSAKTRDKDRGIVWKGETQRVISPYPKFEFQSRRHLSSAEHEEFCMNPRGPSRKAKYYQETDSEPVP